MQLHKELIFKGAEVEKLGFTRAEEVKAVLSLIMPITAEHAAILGIDWAMNGSIAREGLDDVRLGIELEATDFRFPNMPSIKPDLVHKLKLRRTEEAGFELAMLIHIPKFLAHEVLTFFLDTNKNTFALTIKARQGELFENGTRVDLKARAAGERYDEDEDEDVDEQSDEVEESEEEDTAARQTLVTHRQKGFAIPFETPADAVKGAQRRGRKAAKR